MSPARRHCSYARMGRDVVLAGKKRKFAIAVEFIARISKEKLAECRIFLFANFFFVGALTTFSSISAKARSLTDFFLFFFPNICGETRVRGSHGIYFFLPIRQVLSAHTSPRIATYSARK